MQRNLTIIIMVPSKIPKRNLTKDTTSQIAGIWRSAADFLPGIPPFLCLTIAA
jgi:hypothetical protein